MKVVLTFILFFLASSLFAQKTYRENNPESFRGPKKVKIICDSLIKLNRTESQYVGFAASESQSWPWYLALKKKACSKTLFKLTNHPNPVVRFYSYMALMDKNPKKLMKAIRKNENDTVQVFYLNGCIGSYPALIDFVVQQVYERFMEDKNFRKEDLEYLETRKK